MATIGLVCAVQRPSETLERSLPNRDQGMNGGKQILLWRHHGEG